MAKKKYRTIGGKKFELTPTEEEDPGWGACGCLFIIGLAGVFGIYLWYQDKFG